MAPSEKKPLRSTALDINLERTRAIIEIPERYRVLMDAVQDQYAVLKRVEELLVELNHPYMNWEYVLSRLKTLSIGDFYVFSRHADGLDLLTLLAGIYIQVIESSGDEQVRDSALRYLFEFLDTVLSGSDRERERNIELIHFVFAALHSFIGKGPVRFLRKTSTYLKTSMRLLGEKTTTTARPEAVELVFTAFRETYRFWLDQPDPITWGQHDPSDPERRTEFSRLTGPLSHDRIRGMLDRVESLSSEKTVPAHGGGLTCLEMPDFFQIANGYLRIADELERSPAFSGRSNLVKLDFLFNIMNTPGLEDIHGAGLIEINRCLGKVFEEQKDADLQEFVRKIFRSIRKTTGRRRYPSTIIDCIITVAREIFNRNDHPLADIFIEELIAFGFQHPEIGSLTAEGRLRSNPLHILNLRAWLEIISLKPRWTKRLLSALIINLKLKGVFIRDKDLFQKDISSFLNSDIRPAYNLAKQLMRLLPVFFTEIGAEGELRETSTHVDELTHRNDKLIFFLRKQSHVESSSLLTPFTEDIFRFLASGDKTFIRGHLPEDVYEQTDNKGEFFDELHVIFKTLLAKVDNDPKTFIEWDGPRIFREVGGAGAASERERERARLLLRFYQLVYKKYTHRHVDLIQDLEHSSLMDPAKIRSLKRAIRRNDSYRALVIILDLLSLLKEKVFSASKTEYVENIFHKRHVAADIPSMYGTYREEKFEAMGLIFSLESLATTLFEKLVESLNLQFITKSTLMRIHEYLWLYVKALDLDGVTTEGLVSKMRYITAALQVRQISIDQYIDIFQFISKGIQDIIRNYYIDAHSPNLPVIISRITWPDDESTPVSGPELSILHRHSENFVRSMIAQSFGLQGFDNFINSVIRTLGKELEKFKDNKQILGLLMAYIPERTISPLHRMKKELDNPILIGNKGYLLKKLASLSLPVPPGFIITTEVFRGYEAVINYKYIFNDLGLRIFNEIKSIEQATGKKFGDPENPLLLSVRSGAIISLPGMMHSFLNVGLNETIAEALSRKKGFEWAAWDSYRRFLQTWGMFQGLERNIFDEIMNRFKARCRVAKKIQFTADEMRQLAISYKKAMVDRAIAVSHNPYEQLEQAIKDVFSSWDSDQARIYRHQMHVSDEWGTAIIVQTMVFGNLNRHSGSGVLFTRDPRGSSQNVALYGDFIFGVQGEDIVSGLVETHPISERQMTSENRKSPICLESRFPEIYAELVRIAEFLVYEKRFNHQEIEFTFENASRKGLFILQTRDMVQRTTGKVRSFRETPELKTSLLGIGIGVSGGALTGRVVYSEEEIERYRREEGNKPLILIRPDTVPDDVGVLLQVEGILTARGGVTSHAAVTIPQLGKVGVVGFSKLRVYEDEAYSICEGRVIRGGDFIGIDGWTGAVYLGMHEIEAKESYKITL